MMDRHSRRTRVRRRGVTLVEAVLAVGLMVLLVGFLFGFYTMTLGNRRSGIDSVESTQLARVIAFRMADEIRGAMGTATTLGPGIVGNEREIRLNTVVLPDRELFRPRKITDDRLPAQSDLRQIHYYLAYDEENEAEYPDGDMAFENLGLVRREVRTLFQPLMQTHILDQIDTDLVAPELHYLRFRYFDGVEWVKEWNLPAFPGQNNLPQAVEITVGYGMLKPVDPDELELTENELDDIAPPEPFSTDAYTVVVRIPQADTFFGSRLMRAQNKMQSGGLESSGGGGRL